MIELFNVFACAAVAGSLVWAYRWLRDRSPWLAAIFVTGLLLRVALGLFLFTVSYFHLPILERMHFGDGFWTLAIDARTYYETAAGGLMAIDAADPSPTYARTLAVWMAIVGVSPASGMLFNVMCYTLVALLITAIGGDTRAAMVSLGAVTVSPALMIFGTQPLKDSLSFALVAMALAGVALWERGSRLQGTRALRLLATGGGLGCVSVLLMGGMRAYFSLFLVMAMVASAGFVVFAARRCTGTFARLAAMAVLSVALVSSLAAGVGGVYFDYYRDLFVATMRTPLASIAELDKRRNGFVRTGGDTAIVKPPAGVSTAIGTAVRPPSPGGLERLRELARGIAVLFVPVSLLRLLSIVGFEGGRGLILVTDVDTIVMLATLAMSLWVMSRRQWHSAVSVFAIVLAVATTLSMAYVVTNYGTLFRLRLLLAAPIWLLPAFAPQREPETLLAKNPIPGT